MAELYYTFNIDDKELDKSLKKINDSLNIADKNVLTFQNNLNKKLDVAGLNKIGESTDVLNVQLKMLNQVWNQLKFEDKFKKGADDTLVMTDAAKELLTKYQALIKTNNDYGQSLAQVNKAQQDSLDQISKMQAKGLQDQISATKGTSGIAIRMDDKTYEDSLKKITTIEDELKKIDAIKANPNINAKQLEEADKLSAKLKDTLQKLQTSLRAMPLGDLLKIEPKSIAETNKLVSELKLRRDQLLKTDKDYAQNLSALDKRLLDLSISTNQAANNTSKLKKGVEDVGKQTKDTNLFAHELVNTLKTFAGFYFARDAVKQLVDVTGQFELQRVSLQAILQDASAANKIFAQLQGLAVKSPFQFMELTAGAKQLAAMGTAMKDLFSMTKTITDLAAGLGVDMSRLILAVGQVQAASVLRGQELRQFTEAGIPLVQLLADKFSLLEGRVVSTGEVFDKISTRMVSFEMVKDIFTDLTSEGGRFFDIQTKQADTLYGKVSNLKDAYQIMLNDIGSANTELLKGTIDIPMKLMQNWEAVGNALKALMITYGTFKSLSILFSISDTIAKYGSLTKAIQASTAAQKLLNSALITNPFVGWVTALTAIATALYFAYENSQKLNNELSKISSEGLSGVESSVSKFDELYSKLKDAKEGSENFRDAIKAINNQYGEYLPNLLTETNALKELADNYDNVTKAIYNKAKATAAEKGFAAIQEEYGTAQEDAISRFMESLISSGIPKEKAKDLLKLFRTELEKQTGEYNPYELFNKVYEGYFKTTKKYFSDTEQLLNSLIQSGGVLRNIFGTEFVLPGLAKSAEALFDLSRATDNLTISSKDYGDQLDINYNKATYQTAEEAEGVKRINDQYDTIKEKIKANIQTQEEWNEAVKKIEYSKLQATIRFYESIGRTDMVSQLKKQLAGLNEVQDGWRGVVLETIKANKAALSFKPLKDESFFDYIDRLKKAYKEVYEQVKILSTAKIFSPEEKARVESQKAVLDTLSAILGVSLLSEKESKKAAKSRADQLKDEADSVKKLYADYKKFLDYMSAGEAKNKIEELYKGLIPKGLDVFDATEVSKFLTDIGNQIDKLKGKGEGLSLKLDAIEIDRSAISEQIDKSISTINAELEQKKQQYDLFQNLFKTTGDVEFSMQVTASIYGQMEIPDFQEAVKKAISEQFKDADLGIEIESPIVIDEKGAIDLKKTQHNINKIRDEGQKKAAEFYQKQLNDLIGFKVEDAKIWADILKKYSTYEEQRIDIANKAAEERKKIAESDISEEKKRKLTGAVSKKETEDIAKLDFDEFKKTEEWILAFEDLDRISKDALQSILAELEKFKAGAGANLDTTALKEYMSVYKKVRQELEERTPFETFLSGAKDISKYTEALKTAEKGTKEYTDAQNGLRESQIKVNQSLKEIGSRFKDISDAINVTIGMFEDMGIKVPAELGYIADGIGKIGEGLSSIDITKPFSIVTGLVKSIGGIFTSIFAPFKAKNERIIKESEASIKRLQNSYSDLGREIEKTFGQQKYDKISQQFKNLEQQNIELQKQLNTTGKKGGLSKEEAEEIKRRMEENRQAQQDILNDIADDVLGTSREIADRLSNAFIEAAQNGKDAFEAWGKTAEEIVKDIAKKMISEFFLAKTIQKELDAILDQAVDKKTMRLDVNKLISLLPNLQSTINNSIEDYSKALDLFKQFGIDLTAKAEEVTGKGTAQAIQGVTEDTANILGGYMNGIRAEVVIHTGIFNNIYALLQERLSANGGTNSIAQAQLNVMNQQLQELQAIKSILNNTIGEAFDAASRSIRVK